MCFVTYLSKPILDFIVVSEAFVYAPFRPKPIEWGEKKTEYVFALYGSCFSNKEQFHGIVAGYYGRL